VVVEGVMQGKVSGGGVVTPSSCLAESLFVPLSPSRPPALSPLSFNFSCLSLSVPLLSSLFSFLLSTLFSSSPFSLLLPSLFSYLVSYLF
jgi:hypothetical protein